MVPWQPFVGRRDGRHSALPTGGGRGARRPVDAYVVQFGTTSCVGGCTSTTQSPRKIDGFLGRHIRRVLRQTRSGAVFAIVEREMQARNHVRMHHGKT